MNSMNIIMFLLIMLVSLPTLVISVAIINGMTPKTPILIRVALIMIATGALSVFLCPFFGKEIRWTDLLVLAGISLLYISDRRRRKPYNKGVQVWYR